MRCDAALVAREAAPDGIEQAAVDLVDDLQVTGQQHLEPGDRPFFQGLGQQGVVRVGKSPLGQRPCLVPAKVRFVQENSHQLGDGHRRVGVVELDGDFLGKRIPVGVAAAETPHQVGQRAGHQEILLHEAQPLPHARGIIGIQYPRQGLGRERLGLRADKIAGAESLKIEIIRRCGGPEPKRIDRLAAVADHGAVERDAEQRGRLAGDGTQVSATELEGATQLDFHLLVRASDLPGIRPAEPVVGLLVLPAVLNRLTKDAVFVPQTVAHGGKLHRGHRVEETGGQAPEPAVAKARIRFRFKQAEPIEVLLLDPLLGDGIEQEVCHIVGQRATEEKLHRKVIDSLRVLAIIGLLG